MMIDYKMRRKDREADEIKAREILACAEYATLSTVGEDGFPYGVPVNFAFDGEKIYFHCAKNCGHKQENLNFSNKVSLCAVNNCEIVKNKFTAKYESVIVFGLAEKTEDNKRYALELLVKKYSPEFAELGNTEIESAFSHTDVYAVKILKMSAKVHK